MQVTEFTQARTDLLNRMRKPQSGPYGIRILWIQMVNTFDAEREIFRGEHQHLFCEAHLLLSGGGISYRGDGRSVTLAPQQGVFIAPGVRHTYLGEDADYVKCSVAFAADSDGEFARRLQACPFVSFSFGPEIAASLDAIFRMLDENNPLSAHIADNRTFEIVHAILSAIGFAFPGGEDELAGLVDPRLRHAQDYIRSNGGRALSCGEVARHCALSEKQLNRLFQKQVGQSLFQYITEERLKSCERLLLESDYTIKEISRIIGFENEYYFSSFFKRHYGIPPASFRSQNLPGFSNGCGAEFARGEGSVPVRPEKGVCP